MGWTFNTADDMPSIGVRITIIAAIFTALSFAIVCLRMYVRGFIVKAMGADDFAIILSWLASCEYAVGSVAQTRWGLGLREPDNMPTEKFYEFSLLQYIGAPFYVCSLYGFKVSLLLSYLRFMPPGMYQRLTIGVITIITMAHIAFALVFLFRCRPISKQWDPGITEGICLDGVSFYTAFSSLTIVFDIIVMLLPFPVLLETQIRTRKKVVILGLFALGIFVTAIQAIRFGTIKCLKDNLDSALPIQWSIVECNLGIIVACIPTLVPLVKYFSERSKVGSGSISEPRGWSAYAVKSLRMGRQTRITGRQHSGSMELIFDTHGIMKKTEVTVSSSTRDFGDEV